MKQRGQSFTTPQKRREELDADIKRFLRAGNKIETIPDGVSGQDPQGRSKALRPNPRAKGPAKTA